ncbi:MAG: hypothetical protein RR571_05385, partial [Anaerorhabdus sp.]
MKIPKFLKPHSITLINYLNEEINYEKQSKETLIENCKVTGIYADASVVTTGAVNLRVKDGITITIDCSDVEESYIRSDQWDEDLEHIGWTVHVLGDYVLFNGTELAIFGFKEIDPFGKVVFV